MIRSLRHSVVLVAAVLASTAQAQIAVDFNAAGFEHYKAGNWLDAIAAFEQAYGLAPENETIRKNLSNAYQAEANRLAQANAVPQAIEYVLAAVEVNPQSAKALVQLGSYYLREGLNNEAIFRLEEAIELEAGDVDAHFLLGEAYFRDNDAVSALQQWRWVEEVEPGKDGLADRIALAERQAKVEFNFEDRSSRNFRMTYNQDVSWSQARDVLYVLESAYRDIGRQLGGAYPPGPIQVTLYTSEGFSEATQMGDHIGGLYDGSKIRVPAFDKTGAPVPLDELRRRLIHEYVHVVVRHLAKERVPWWLNEGLAETLSRDIDTEDLHYLRKAKQNGVLFALEELSESQLETLDVDSLKLAYRQSHAVVTLLKNHFGPRRIADILRNIGAGAEPETAIKQSCHYSYGTLERALSAFIG